MGSPVHTARETGGEFFTDYSPPSSCQIVGALFGAAASFVTSFAQGNRERAATDRAARLQAAAESQSRREQAVAEDLTKSVNLDFDKLKDQVREKDIEVDNLKAQVDDLNLRAFQPVTDPKDFQPAPTTAPLGRLAIVAGLVILFIGAR